MNWNDHLKRALPILLFVFALSFCFFQIQSTDVFMYLALARDFLFKGQFGNIDPYLYALQSTHLDWWHEYLSYALFAGFYDWFDWAGLILLKTLILALGFVLTLRARPREHNLSPVFICMWILAVVAASFRFIERSSLISDLFTLIIILRLVDFAETRPMVFCRRRLIEIFVLFLLWVQFHPGFPIGLIFLSTWMLWSWFHHSEARRWSWIFLSSALLALLINPLGLNGLTYPFRFAMNEAQTLKHFNYEWFPTFHPAFRFAPEVIAFWVLCATALYLMARERALRSLNTWFTLISIALGFSAIRFVPWASFAILICAKPWAHLRFYSVRPRIKTGLATALALALTVLSIKQFLWGYDSSSGPRRPGFSLDPTHIPIQTVDFLKKNRLAGHLYNSHEFGAFLIWEGFLPVFHHGFVTDMDFYRQDVMGVFQSQNRFLELAKKYDWTMLLVEKSNSYPYFFKILSPLAEWKIVAEDQASYLIYRLPPPAN